MSFHERTRNVAKGKWRGILLTFGLPETCLRNKHGKCPICDSNNFRWDDKDGSGSYICTCGSGDGFQLLERVTGRGFREVAPEIDAMAGNIRAEAPRRDMSDADVRNLLVSAWQKTQPVEPGDLVHRYLQSRGVEELIYPKALRFAPAMPDGEGGIRPCMVAMVGVWGEAKFCSMHRTFLKPDGSGKANMEAPRKMMAGALPDGACVALSDYHGGPLGIAEGIETAMAASALFGLPVWSAINAPMLAKWSPPDECSEVAIFADNDPKFGGQKAAYALAHRLACKGVHVTVHIPEVIKSDWNDVLLGKAACPTTRPSAKSALPSAQTLSNQQYQEVSY